MYLLDTNIWLARLLDQEGSRDVGELLNLVSSKDLFITDFSFHSIGIVLGRLKKYGLLLEFIDDLFVTGDVKLIEIRPPDTKRVINPMSEYSLDFDDAYQYAVAEQHDLILVSFDADFIKTKRGRKLPKEIIKATE